MIIVLVNEAGYCILLGKWSLMILGTAMIDYLSDAKKEGYA